MTGLDLTLRAGELLLLRVPAAQALTPVPDLACGVLDPDQGAVGYRGRDWRDRSPDAAAAARGTIGRVFDGGGWISNLDLDENILLAARYHARRPDADIRAEAAALALELGQPAPPRVRPALLPRAELRQAQWVRALLGRPELLLLERPAREVPTSRLPPLFDCVRRARARGAAVVWIAADEEGDPAPDLGPTLLLELRGTAIRVAG